MLSNCSGISPASYDPIRESELQAYKEEIIRVISTLSTVSSNDYLLLVLLAVSVTEKVSSIGLGAYSGSNESLVWCKGTSIFSCEKLAFILAGSIVLINTLS